MHPLLKRILIRGPFMFLATAGIGLAFALLMRWMITTGNSTDLGGNVPGQVSVSVNTGSDGGIDFRGPLTFGVIGFVVYAALESLAYLRERRKK